MQLLIPFQATRVHHFLALVEMIKIEAHIAQRDLSSNITLAQEHANHTGLHLDMNQKTTDLLS
jgi:hypothetical protein